MEVAELFLEIGTEEIPSGYIKKGLMELMRLAEGTLKENRLMAQGGAKVYGTPRRLVLVCEGVPEKQEDMVQEITGPPKKVAYDDEGNPTRAAHGFAKKQGLDVSDLTCIRTEKGEYLYCKQTIPGRKAREILSEALPQMISAVPWPKSMRWGDVGVAFARPIHWIVALMEGEVIPFEFAAVKAGCRTFGHRFMSPGGMDVTCFEDYRRRMRDSFVIIEPDEREALVEKQAFEAAGRVGGAPSEDPELVSTVANLVEFPSAVCGSFEENFLALPEKVLITAMREHQKYFAIYSGEGELMPHFVAVNNTGTRDESIVTRGHERVLRARLSDADFFFKEDAKTPLAERKEALKGVIYQAELGTSYAKVMRFRNLAVRLAGVLIPEKAEDAAVAAELCKCDLITQMVGEFPSLQGIMGKEYARMDGHKEDVCQAIEDHYRPLRAGGELPLTDIGAVVGIADRMDTIAGYFAIGLEPTGSADPFALRRHALAVIRILEARGWDISLTETFESCLDLLKEKLEFDSSQVLHRIVEFMRERYRQMMLRSGYDSDVLEAVISVDFDRLGRLRKKVGDLGRFSAESDRFQDIALTSKRITNMLKKEKGSYEVDPSLFRHECETALFEACKGMEPELFAFAERGGYLEAMNLMTGLVGPVDDFFEGVEILTKESEALRNNRIGMLQRLRRIFIAVADFSRFSI